MGRRALAALSLAALLPWLLFRAIPGLLEREGALDYLQWVLWSPVEPWTRMDAWWWHTMLAWYDWPFLPALTGLLVAAAWPVLVAPILRWVGAGKRA